MKKNLLIWHSVFAKVLFITLIALNVSHLWAQEGDIVVRGIVMDSRNEALLGVTVIEKGTSNGTITDIDGSYTLKAKPNSTLIFSFVGMETTEVDINGRVDINVHIDASAIGLDEVVAVGYGTMSKRTLTSAVTKVSGDVLKDIPITTVGDGLKGRISGARVYANDNSPGSDPIIRIRGGSSINKSNNPLILVDGVERSFSGINPNDVESIEILKDAASTAIYGSRASNGVVLISTRRGKENEAPQITFTSQVAMQGTERMYDFMNARDYINTVRSEVALGPFPQYNYNSGFSASSGNTSSSIYTTRYLNDGETVPEGYQFMPDPLDPTKTLIFQDNSIVDELYRDTFWQNYYLGVNGGSKNVNYNASVGYVNDDGVALATGFKRFNALVNLDVKISDNIKFSSGVDFSQSLSQDYASQFITIARGLATAPTKRLLWDDGTPAPGYNYTSPDPIWYDYYNNREKKTNRLSINGALEIGLGKGLTLNGTASMYDDNYSFNSFEKSNEFNKSRTATTAYANTQRNKLETYLSYKNVMNDSHSVSAMVGYSYQNEVYENINASADGASSDKVPTLNAAPNKKTASTIKELQTIMGGFSRLMYDYEKKYIVMATIRADGSFKFSKKNRWGVFPGMSAGWVISEESFLNDNTTISNLKLRTSYGLTGNSSIGLYDTFGQYNVSARYEGDAGFLPQTMPNENLKWESTKQLDLGIDFGLFNNRIYFSGDYFSKNTEDLLFSKTLPNTTGFSSVQSNTGTVKFSGFDINIETHNITNENFSWVSNFTWSFVENKVTELPDNGRDKNRIGGITLDDGTSYGGIAEGEPLYRFYGYMVDGILETEEAANNARFDELSSGYVRSDMQRIKGRKDVGDYEWKDRDGNNIINSKDQFELGVTVPKNTGGFGNNFKYKDFDLNIYFDWAMGHSINDVAYMRYFMNTFSNNYALVEDVKDTWKQPGDETVYARFAPDDSALNRNFSRSSNVFTFKGDYLCLRDVSLSYNIPVSKLDNIGLKSLSLTVSGNTLFYLTAAKGLSPEAGSGGTYSGNFFNYPAIRKISFGAKLTF